MLLLQHSIALQTDGKIVVAGNFIKIINGNRNSQFAVVRYNTNGSLDNTFGTNGFVNTDFVYESDASSIALQADGKIVVAGYYTNYYSGIAVVRYNTNGGLDSSFDTDGIVVTSIRSFSQANSLSIQTDGKIVVAGIYSNDLNNINTGFTVVRYNIDGSLDNTFDNYGINTIDIADYSVAKSVSIQTDGKILVSGYRCILNDCSNIEFVVVRYNTNGTLDSSFGNTGIVTISVGGNSMSTSMSIQTDGKILVAGYIWDNIAVLRYKKNGYIDSTFDNDGKVNTTFGNNIYSGANCIAIQTDGKILVAGIYITQINDSIKRNFAIVRYNNTISGIENVNNINLENSVYPNPFSEQTTIQSNCFLDNASLIVNNTLGEQVKQVNNLYGQRITFNRDNLPSGIYFIKVSQENKQMITKKIILKD
ncbi:MAG: T9SS type A sorting domain-containing protein [Bacteroidetes bacterium]|nr:T9SS type A sorting domain-containing protein [Bacteroidota bacterium]